MITCLDGFFSISVLQPAIQSQQTQTEIVYFFCHPLSTEINRTDHRSARLGDNTMTVQPVISPSVALQDASPHKAQSPPTRGAFPLTSTRISREKWFQMVALQLPPKGTKCGIAPDPGLPGPQEEWW